MSDNTIVNVNGQVANENWNQFYTALVNDFVGRNGFGAPEEGKSLGTAAIPWGNLHVNSVFINGKFFDPSTIGTASSNGIVSGQTRTDSDQPDFIRAQGIAPAFDILGSSTNLNFNVNDVGVTVSTDLTLGSLDTAPLSNNTALVNNTELTGNSNTLYEGENTGSIALDNAGSEITDRIGQYIALQHGTSEIMMAYVAEADGGANTATLKHVFRGFFFDSSGDPIKREVMSNNDVLTLYNLAWVFLQVDGTTIDVTYRTPKWSGKAPTSPVVDDYWYDTANQEWKRYDGTQFETIDRALLGMVVMDGTNCIASRSLDFVKSYSEFIDLEMEQAPLSATQVQTAYSYSRVDVYGNDIEFNQTPNIWDITTDLEAGLTEATDTLYYLYVSEKGENIISDERPYNRTSDLKGYYHPYHTWRFVGVAFNDSSSDFSSANSKNNNQQRVDVFTSSAEFLPLPNAESLKVTIIGSGGGALTGSNGTQTSFGSIMTANGGSRGEVVIPGSNIVAAGAEGGSGGTATGGDINIQGQQGNGSTVTTSAGTPINENYGNGGNSALGRIGGGFNGSFSGSSFAGGGGAGGTAIKWINNLSSRVQVTVGTANTDGICIVEY